MTDISETSLISRHYVDALNMDIIFPKICGQIHVICETVGMDCSEGKVCEASVPQKEQTIF